MTLTTPLRYEPRLGLATAYSCDGYTSWTKAGDATLMVASGYAQQASVTIKYLGGPGAGGETEFSFTSTGTIVTVRRNAPATPVPCAQPFLCVCVAHRSSGGPLAPDGLAPLD